LGTLYTLAIVTNQLELQGPVTTGPQGLTLPYCNPFPHPPPRSSSTLPQPPPPPPAPPHSRHSPMLAPPFLYPPPLFASLYNPSPRPISAHVAQFGTLRPLYQSAVLCVCGLCVYGLSIYFPDLLLGAYPRWASCQLPNGLPIGGRCAMLVYWGFSILATPSCGPFFFPLRVQPLGGPPALGFSPVPPPLNGPGLFFEMPSSGTCPGCHKNKGHSCDPLPTLSTFFFCTTSFSSYRAYVIDFFFSGIGYLLQ